MRWSVVVGGDKRSIFFFSSSRNSPDWWERSSASDTEKIMGPQRSHSLSALFAVLCFDTGTRTSLRLSAI